MSTLQTHAALRYATRLKPLCGRMGIPQRRIYLGGGFTGNATCKDCMKIHVKILAREQRQMDSDTVGAP